jgi:hypothetical protein
MFVNNKALLIYQNSRKHILFAVIFIECLTFERFTVIGVSDLDVSLDVNELFRFTQTGLVGARNLSNMFDGIHIMCLSS